MYVCVAVSTGGCAGVCSPLTAIYQYTNTGGGGGVNEPIRHSHARILY